MRYFKEAEFREWYEQIDPRLLRVIDEFRHKWGAPVSVSTAPGSIGRTTGSGFHNYVKHGSVQAIDLIPSGMDTAKSRQRAFEAAMEAGATGIGIYPMWAQGGGIHIDIGERPGRGIGNPARWSAYYVDGEQEYFALEKAFEDE